MKEIKAFECGFCRKIYRSERGVNNHELRCVHNPDNFRPCFSCQHLTKEQAWATMYEQYTTANIFFCKKHEVFMYPPITGHKKNFIETDEPQNPMPKVCTEFKDTSSFNNLISFP